MNFDEQLELLRAAKGDPAQLALATVDLQLAGHPRDEREKVREALEVAAIPHWFDERILAALLEIEVAKTVALLVRLRELNVVEPFFARGPGAMNVHQTVRTALRRRLAMEDPYRMHTLSSLAYRHFAARDATPAVIERLYHRFISDSARVADKCGAIFREWSAAGRHEPLLALRTMLEELLNLEPWALPAGLVRGAALYYLVKIRNASPRLDDDGETTEKLAQNAIVEFDGAGVRGRAVRGRVLLGDVLKRVAISEADLKRAISAYEGAIALAQSDKFGPRASDGSEQRLVANVYGEIASIRERLGEMAAAAAAARKREEVRPAPPPSKVAATPENEAVAFELAAVELEKKGDLAVVLLVLRAALDARQRVAKEQPENAKHRSHLSIAHHRVGDALRRQGNVGAASAEFRKGMAIRELLAKEDSSNREWQREFAAACHRTASVLIELSEGDRAEARTLIERGASIMQALARIRALTLDECEVLENLDQLAAKAGVSPLARDE
jgi:tetratricopeptide (TPR) repeat protein